MRKFKVFISSLATRIFLVLMLTSLASGIFSQPSKGQGRRFEERSEKIQAKRVAFITNKVGLTPEEAQQFWPIYNQFVEKQIELMLQQRQVSVCFQTIDDKTEAELIHIAEKEIVMAENMSSLRREYHDKYMNILPVKKVVLLYIAEKEFNRELFREMRQRGREGFPRN